MTAEPSGATGMRAGRSSPRFVLFDLDGTLVDPGPGIIGSAQHALKELGRDVPPAQDMQWIVGPPLRQSFARLLGTGDMVEKAVELYRAAYGNGGITQASPYPGIFDALDRLRRKGHLLYLCTAKPLPFARRVIDHFDFAAYFDALSGAELDGRFDDKGALVDHILASRGLRAEHGCMVGDRAIDTLAARQNGMPSVGVTWGYGHRRELLENGATVLCERVRDLPDQVEQLLRG